MLERCALPLVALLALAAPEAAQGQSRGSVALSIQDDELVLGQKTTIDGTVYGVRRPEGRRVVVEADPYPYGRYRVVERLRSDRAGRFTVVARPARNTRVRARIAGVRGSTGRPVTLYADFPARIVRGGAGGPRPQVRFTVYAFPRAQVRRAPVFAYIRRAERRPYLLVGRARWTTRTRRYVAASLTYPAGTLVESDEVFLCAKEPRPDAFGRPDELERQCGAPEIRPRELERGEEGTPSSPEPAAWSLRIAGDDPRREVAFGPPEELDISATPSTLEASAGSWGVRLSVPRGQRLAVGTYPADDRLASVGQAAALDVEQPARACSETTGEFTIHELVWELGELRRVRVSFRQECNLSSFTGDFDFTAR